MGLREYESVWDRHVSTLVWALLPDWLLEYAQSTYFYPEHMQRFLFFFFLQPREEFIPFLFVLQQILALKILLHQKQVAPEVFKDSSESRRAYFRFFFFVRLRSDSLDVKCCSEFKYYFHSFQTRGQIALLLKLRSKRQTLQCLNLK